MNFRLSALLAAVFCLAVPAAGQVELRDYGFVTGNNPFLGLSNPAATSFWDGRIAVAELSFDKRNGGLVDIDESPDCWEVKLGTESFFRVSDLISFYGQISWQSFQGKNMGGHILMNPDYNPVNFLETAETNPGTKKRELYTMKGEVGFTPWKKWRFGVGFDYQAGDRIKDKDPRFSNVWMDLGVRAGVMFSPSDRFAIGLSATWRNTIEQVKGHIYGASDKTYNISTDKGGFFGTIAQLSGDYNYIPETTARPMNNDWWGGALQAVFGGNHSIEGSFALRKGYWGKKSSTTATFFEFSGYKAGYKGLHLFPSGKNLHRLEINAEFEKLSNWENAFRYDTPEGGNTIVVYTGQTNILNRYTYSASLDYKWYGSVQNGLPSWYAGLRGGWNTMSQTTTIYPFWRKGSISQIDAELLFCKNFFFRKGYLTAEISAIGHAGYGLKKADGTYVQTGSTSLRSFDAYLDKHYEFETAARAGGSLSIQYTLPVNSVVAPWIKISDTLITLLSAPEYLSGASRNAALVSIGCNF